MKKRFDEISTAAELLTRCTRDETGKLKISLGNKGYIRNLLLSDGLESQSVEVSCANRAGVRKDVLYFPSEIDTSSVRFDEKASLTLDQILDDLDERGIEAALVFSSNFTKVTEIYLTKNSEIIANYLGDFESQSALKDFAKKVRRLTS